MNKTTTIVIALLVLMNLILVTFLYVGRPHKRNHKTPKEIIIERLDLNENQVGEYDDLIDKHREKVQLLQEEIASIKTSLYQEADNNNVVNDSIISLIGKKFEELEKTHQEHFLGIKSLCDENQKIKYKELSNHLHKIFTPKLRRHKRKKH